MNIKCLSKQVTNNVSGRENEHVIKILTCFIKPWQVPCKDIFLPIHGGKAISTIDLEMQGDDTGDNISDKNVTFGEFTAWYWAWKNIKNMYPNLEYIGLSHYRRYFAMSESKRDGVIKVAHIPDMNGYATLFINELKKYDMILAEKAAFDYNLMTQYSFAHNSFDYHCLKQIVHELYPEYDNSFIYIFEENNKMSLYCIFVSKYTIFDEYFTWLFPILFEAERRINVSNYPPYQKRVLAFLAERLINVYVYHNKLNVSYKPIYFIVNDVSEIKNETNKNIFLFKKYVKAIVALFLPHGIFKLYKYIRKRKDLRKRGTSYNV